MELSSFQKQNADVIIGQGLLLKRLGFKNSKDMTLDPYIARQFRKCCYQYEDYLKRQVQRAIQHVIKNPEEYSKKQYVLLKVDLVNKGLKDSKQSNEVIMPFHVAHYGMQLQQSDGSVLWTKRAVKTCWRNAGLVIPPFVKVQRQLATLGYTLVDFSYIGGEAKAHLRLYYKGIPTKGSLLQHIRKRFPNETVEFEEDRWFWHGYQRMPMWYHVTPL